MENDTQHTKSNLDSNAHSLNANEGNYILYHLKHLEITVWNAFVKCQMFAINRRKQLNKVL